MHCFPLAPSPNSLVYGLLTGPYRNTEARSWSAFYSHFKGRQLNCCKLVELVIFAWCKKGMVFLRKTCKTSMGELCSILVTTLLLWETREVCNCYYTCTHVACFMQTSTKNEWNTQNIILSLSSMFGPPITHNLIMHVLTNYQVKLMQGTALEQSLLTFNIVVWPALCNLRLLLVVL